MDSSGKRSVGGTFRIGDGDVEEIARRAAEIVKRDLSLGVRPGGSPYLTIPEAAAHLRCRRQRVDDLLSQGRLTRVKDGGRTLIARAELEAYLRGEPTGRRAAGAVSSIASRPRAASGKAGSGRSSGTRWT